MPTLEGLGAVPDDIVIGFGRIGALAPLGGLRFLFKGAMMPKPNFAALAVIFMIGVGSLIRFSQNLFHFSQNVRVVDVVGLSGGGAACGAALFGFIFALMARNKA